MPVSVPVHLSYCLSAIIKLAPRSVLDVGCGFGLWGFLCREHLDVWAGRVQPDEWEVRIDGIELFEPYIQAHHRALYSSIRIADIRDAVSDIDEYDLIIAGDVIEHLEKDEGEAVLAALYGKARKALIVNIPLGKGWEHAEQYGNPGERHRSEWVVEELALYSAHYELFELPCGQYGSFICMKDTDLESRIAGHEALAEHHVAQGDFDKAIDGLRAALALNPRDENVALHLTDVLVRAKRLPEAIEAIDAGIEQVPSFHAGYVLVAKLNRLAGNDARALEILDRLLAQEDVDPQLREQAEALRAEAMS